MCCRPSENSRAKPCHQLPPLPSMVTRVLPKPAVPIATGLSPTRPWRRSLRTYTRIWCDSTRCTITWSSSAKASVPAPAGGVRLTRTITQSLPLQLALAVVSVSTASTCEV